MAELKPTPLAHASLAALVLPPLAGAAVALVQDSWKPLGFGALCAAGLLVALIVGSGVVDAWKARRSALRARNGVHPDRGEERRLRYALDRLVEAHDDRCHAPVNEWADGVWDEALENARRTLLGVRSVVQSRSESGERGLDFTDPNVTRSPDPGHTGA